MQMQLTEHAITRYRERILPQATYAEAEAHLRAAVESAVPLRETMRDKGRESDRTFRYGIDDPPCVLLVTRVPKGNLVGLTVKTVITEEMDRRNSEEDLAVPLPTGQATPPRRALSAAAYLADHFTERSQQGDPHASDLAGAFRRLREAFVDAPAEAAEASTAVMLRYYQLIAGTLEVSWRRDKLDAIVTALEAVVPESARACEDAEVVAFAEATSAMCLALSRSLEPGTSDQRSWAASAGVWSDGARTVRTLLRMPAEIARPALPWGRMVPDIACTAHEAITYLADHCFDVTLQARDARNLSGAFQRLAVALAEAPARARETPAGALRHGFALLAEGAHGKAQDKMRAIVAALDLVVRAEDRTADPDLVICLWDDIRMLCAAQARSARVGTGDHGAWSASCSVWAEGTRTLQGLRRARRFSLGTLPTEPAEPAASPPTPAELVPPLSPLPALHQALRAVLGEHVTEKGSYVGLDWLTFDFTHDAPLSAAEQQEVDLRANVALGETDLLEIVSDLSVCKGVRRIRAVTGRAAHGRARASLAAARPAHPAAVPAAPDLAELLFGRLESLLSGIPVRRMRLLRLGWADTCLDEHGIPMEPGAAQAWLAQRLVGELRQHPQGVRIGLTRLIEWADAGLSLTPQEPVTYRIVDGKVVQTFSETIFCPCGAEARDGTELVHQPGCPFVALPTAPTT